MPSVNVGDSVHYTSFGTPGGEYDKACRAATVTEVDDGDPENPGDPAVVGLAVFNPTGLFFRSLADGGCAYNGEPRPSGRAGGTWHLATDCGS
jgi:hypothetical protein